jgi:hypothetical protein
LGPAGLLDAVGVGIMKLEWMRADDSTNTFWACFEIYDDRAHVLAIISHSERVDQRMTLDDARALWDDLRQRGWHHATEEEINQSNISRRPM